MTVDVVYLSHNRKAFTELTFRMLLGNTDWDMVRRLCVYDDSSTDGTADWLRDALTDAPVPWSFVSHGLESPVAVMNSYMADYAPGGDCWAKIDSDIVVCPGWLPRLVEVVAASPELDALGMEPGRGQHALPFETERGWMGCSHIGGVGLLRTDALRRRSPIPEHGRFGWTAFQHQQRIQSGWVAPDLDAFALDLLPFEPWKSLTRTYIDAGWAREWPAYAPRASARFWEWCFPAAVPA